MRLSSVRRGDIVYIDKGGRRFVALVMEIRPPEVEVEPLTRGVTYRRAHAREVVGHWRRSAGTPDLRGAYLEAVA